MKKLLLLWLALSALLPASAQNRTKKVKVRNPLTQAVLYEAYAPYNASAYPFLGGKTRFEADASSGTFSLTTLSGCVIPAGTRPPRIEPTCTVVNPAPSWISGFRYSNDNTTLTFEAAGPVGKLMFEDPSGSPFTTTNPNGVIINSGTFYGYGSNPADQNPYDRQWRINRTSPIKVTAQQENGTATYVYTVNPLANANKVVLTGSSSTTTTNPGSTTTAIAYNKVLFIGNSILRFPGAVPAWNWYNDAGMAASDSLHDWFHLTQTFLKTLNPNVSCRRWGEFTGTSVAEGGYWEQNFGDVDTYDRYNAIAAWVPDLIIIRFGENVPPSSSSSNLLTNLGRLVDKLKSLNPSCRVLVSNSVWGQVEVSNILQSFATTRGYPFVNLFDMWGQAQYYASYNDGTTPDQPGSTWYHDAGVAKHPNNTGMAEIARRVIAKIPTSTTVTSTTGTTTVSNVTSYFANGFGEGTYSQLVNYAPFVPTTNQLSSLMPYSKTPVFLDNGIVRLGLGPIYGGTTVWFGLSGGDNWINHNADNSNGTFTYTYNGTTYTVTGLDDGGRQMDYSMYGTPLFGFTHLFPDGHTGTTAEFFDTGWNPVAGSSVHKNYSGITFYERRTVPGYGDVVFMRTVPKIWALHDVDSEEELHQWHWLEGNMAKHYSIIVNHRTDTQMIHEGREQEGRMAYPIAPLWHHSTYTGNNPGNSGSESLQDFSTPAGGFSDIYNGTEYWVAAMNDQGLGIVEAADYTSRVKGGQFGGTGGNEFSGSASYLNSSMLLDMDNPHTYAFSGRTWAGSLSGWRNYYNSANIQHPAFSWTFGQNNNCGWWSSNAPATYINNQYSLNIGKGRPGDQGTSEEGRTVHFGQISSPYGAWKASDIPVVYVKFQITGGLTNLRLGWKKSGADNSAGHSKNFTAANTTAVQTIAIPMSGVADWDGFISTISIGLDDIHTNTSGNEQFTPIYIGKNQPNAVGDWQTLILLSGLAGGLRRRRLWSVRSEKPKQSLKKRASKFKPITKQLL